MGLNPGRNNRKLVDMTEPIVEESYTVPSDVDILFDTPIDLLDDIVLHVHQTGKWGKIHDFSLNQYATPNYEGNYLGENTDIARIDCAHSEIHQHQFYRSGRRQNRDTLHPLKGGIDHNESVELINDQYYDCYDQMVDNWETYLERWED